MNMEDIEILERITKERNTTHSTFYTLKTIVKQYTKFHNMTLQELLDEAEREEDEGIRWKHRTLKTRLIDFRAFLLEEYSVNTARAYINKIKMVYRHYEIEVHQLPFASEISANHPQPITFQDLPDKEIIRKAIGLSKPDLEALILFISSSGCAKREALNLTIKDLIIALKEYHTYPKVRDIYIVINNLRGRTDLVPTFKLRRQKTNKFYYTFCSPEAVNAIFNMILLREPRVKPDDPLFDISSKHLSFRFKKINDTLGLGKRGTYNRFRSHMLRKFHASYLHQPDLDDGTDYGLTMDQIDALQGRSKNTVQSVYFMDNPEILRKAYIKAMNRISITEEYVVDFDEISGKPIIELYDGRKENKSIKQQLSEEKEQNEVLSLENTEVKKENAEVKKENREMHEENKYLKSNIEDIAQKAAQEILRENLPSFLEELGY